MSQTAADVLVEDEKIGLLGLIARAAAREKLIFAMASLINLILTARFTGVVSSSAVRSFSCPQPSISIRSGRCSPSSN